MSGARVVVSSDRPKDYRCSRPSPDYAYQPRSSFYPSWQPKQLYDPNKPSNSAKVVRTIPPTSKKKPHDTIDPSTSTLSVTAEPFSVPSTITILRKPSADHELTTPVIPPPLKDLPVPLPEEKEAPAAEAPPVESSVSFPSDELLSILQSANCIAALNEYAQQKKFSLNYEFSSPSSSTSFSCVVSIDGQRFPPSAPCVSKNEAQKLACDHALRTLYQQSCAAAPASSVVSTNKHDLIAQRSVSAFQDLNVNSSLLGRKTLACMLMVRNDQFDQGRVISMATGNTCLDQTNLGYAEDGLALHDCHAEILARRGLIRFFLEQMKQMEESAAGSIFEYNSTDQKYRLRDGITFHMYISALPCGNASLNIPCHSLRYKQGQTEGTQLASTTSFAYPIKSCTDKICRWNILGIQGGLLIDLLLKPIYLTSITLACENTFDRLNVQRSLSQRLKDHCQPLPAPYLFNLPDIDCPQIKSFQQERQVAKLQSSAFAWNVTQANKTELLEPMTGRLK